MFIFIIENIGTIVIGLLLACMVTAIILKIVRDKQEGKCTGCECGCNKKECALAHSRAERSHQK